MNKKDSEGGQRQPRVSAEEESYPESSSGTQRFTTPLDKQEFPTHVRTKSGEQKSASNSSVRMKSEADSREFEPHRSEYGKSSASSDNREFFSASRSARTTKCREPLDDGTEFKRSHLSVRVQDREPASIFRTENVKASTSPRTEYRGPSLSARTEYRGPSPALSRP